VAIAACITARARIEMSEYIMKNSGNIYAVDTDGIKISSELPKEQVGPELGQMKFEDEFIDSVFIAPKVYGGITTKGDMIVKAKGVKSKISY
jgi:hypothetical protein